MIEEQVTVPRTLFRPEAIEAHARGRGSDDEGLELREGQTAWTFRLLMIALALAIVAGLTVKVDETARGDARVAGTSATVELPVSAAPRLRAGQPVTLRDARGTVVSISRAVTKPDGKVVLPVFVTFDKGRPFDGEASVRLSRKTLGQLLLRRNG